MGGVFHKMSQISHFTTLVFLLLVVSFVQARWIVSNKYDKTLWQDSLSKKGRVKREWSYPAATIVETINGFPFNPREVVTVKSTNTDVSRYILVDNVAAVTNGIFTMTTLTSDAGTKQGEIMQQQPVDREVVSQYILTVSAVSSAGVQVEDDVQITVNVIDINDNGPVFQESSLFGDASENTAIGSVILRLRATDLDDPSSGANYNGKVYYEYVGDEEPSTTSPRFSVSQTGDVTLLTQLDRETVPEITFVVKATDGLPGFTTGSNSATATATVVVLDANDHAPVFTNTEYQTTIGELLPVQSSIITVAATDADISNNAAVYFRIGSGNIGGKFSMVSYPNAAGESTGQVILEKALDFEAGDTQFVLTIVAYNKNTTNAAEFESTADVTITVNDENEPPVFLDMPYTGYVRENRNVTVDNIATVHAVDYDFGGTQSVTYSIVDPKGWFSITQEGVISAIAPIDREDPSVNQETDIYTLLIKATDNYEDPKFSTAPVAITIGDVNDNGPEPANAWDATICEKPNAATRSNITTIRVTDKDSADNGPPFDIAIGEQNSPFMLEMLSSGDSALVQTTQTEFDASTRNKYEIPIILVDTASAGENRMTSTHTLVIHICSCAEDSDQTNGAQCLDVVVDPAGISITLIIIIIALILILLIIVLAVVAYRRRTQGELEKQALFYDEDDVRENLQAYHDEGGGEEDNDGYDISALQAPPLIAPKRQDEPPLGGAQPQPRSRVPPDTDIGDYINDAKKETDNDPTAPPFDSLLVFDYEGQGSDAGSLSSLNSGTTDGSQDYDHLRNWGPRFKKLADMYGGGESD